MGNAHTRTHVYIKYCVAKCKGYQIFIDKIELRRIKNYFYVGHE